SAGRVARDPSRALAGLRARRGFPADAPGALAARRVLRARAAAARARGRRRAPARAHRSAGGTVRPSRPGPEPRGTPVQRRLARRRAGGAGARSARPGRSARDRRGGAMSARDTGRIHSLEIPLVGFSLLVPSAVVAEVANPGALYPVPRAPAWLLGVMAWRAQPVPLVSFEALTGR